MALDNLQRSNIGTPDFAQGTSTANRKLWAIVTTIAFGIFWISGLFVVSSWAGDATMHWSMPVLAGSGLAVGLFARRRVDAR